MKKNAATCPRHTKISQLVSLFWLITLVALLPFRIVAGPGRVDTTFANTDVGDTINGLGPYVNCAISVPGGKSVIGGRFIAVDGSDRTCIARLKPDGGLDPSFNAHLVGEEVNCITALPDGKFLIGGKFTSISGQLRLNLARLNNDGTIDPSFHVDANGEVVCMAVQPDFRILVGGAFTTMGGQSFPYLARLFPDGTLEGFSPDVSGAVSCIMPLADGKILIGGAFTKVHNENHNYLARLQSTGVVDSEFVTSTDARVLSIAQVSAGGKILIGGDFTHVAGSSRNHLARLNENGSLDTANPNVTDDRSNVLPTVSSIAIQGNGQAIFSGLFNLVGGLERRNIARLGGDGNLEFIPPSAGRPEEPAEQFDPDASDAVYGVTLLNDRKMLVTGAFERIGPELHFRVARLVDDNSSLFFTGAGLYASILSFSGDNSAVRAVSFELSTDGGDTYILLGDASRVFGTDNAGNHYYSWQLGGLHLPANGQIRTRSQTACGRYNGSTGLEETITAFSNLSVPELQVSGGAAGHSVIIQNNDISPSLADGTDFGVFDSRLRVPNQYNIFTITNLNSPFTLAKLEARNFALTGPNADDFYFEQIDDYPGGYQFWTWDPRKDLLAYSPRFVIGLRSNAQGLHRATVTFQSADYDESRFSFDIQVLFTDFSNADLSALTLTTAPSPGSPPITPAAVNLTPAFASEVTDFNATVGYDILGITVIPTKATVGGNIVFNNLGIVSGGSSPFIALNVGTNTLPFKVVSQSGNSKTYTINVVRSGVRIDSAFAHQADGSVLSLAAETSANTLIGGSFAKVDSQTRNRLARLNPNVDAFNPNVNGTVNAIASLADGKSIIGGTFSAVGASATPRNNIARLNNDGTVDPAFNPNVNGVISAMAIQADGKILIGGSFTSVGSPAVTRNRLARLSADGSLDAAFNPNMSGDVLSLALQWDGKILIAGNFTQVGSSAHNRLARLNADGTLDESFNPNVNASIFTVAAQPDRSILIGGQFSVVNGVGRNHLARIFYDGALEDTFNLNLNGDVTTIALQADGKIIIGGQFTSIGAVARNRVARLDVNGNLDPYFNLSADSTVQGVSLQTNGKIMLGGDFTHIGAEAHSRIASIYNDAAFQTLSVTSLRHVQWLRSGSAPGVASAVFELSTDNGVTYAKLGDGAYDALGWELDEVSLPSSGLIRVRARAASGYHDASSSAVEAVVSFSGLAVPQIAVKGNDIEIPNHDLTPRLNDLTDFGAVTLVNNGSIVRTFTIQNTGGVVLALGQISVIATTPVVSPITTQPRPEFVVTTQPPSSVPPHSSVTFQVTFTPADLGLRSATLVFLTDGNDERRFVFGVQGTGAPSSNSDLLSLTLGGGAILSPAFDAGTFNYTATLPVGASTLFITPTKADPNATILFRINNIVFGATFAVESGVLGTIPIDGQDHLEVYVRAQDLTSKLYNITFVRSFATLDTGFNLSATGGPVMGMAAQPDGKILLSGAFNQLGTATRNRLARLNADGSLDAAFDPNANSDVYSQTVQPDGKIVIGGSFTTLGGVTRNHIARLNADGSLENSFDPNANGVIYSTALQADGGILVGGSFTTIGNVARNRFARLNSNGTLDLTFDPNVNSAIYGMSVQADGKIVIAGDFTMVGDQPRNYIARLNANGSLDTGFNPNAGAGIRALAVQADDKILIGGNFTTVGGTPRNHIARLNRDGTLDFSFDPNVDVSPRSLAVQADGKIILSGLFSSVGGTPRHFVARINADGSLDNFFNPDADNIVFGILIQADGRVLLGGSFTKMSGATHNGIARMINDPATQNLTVPNVGRVQWLRAGSSPEAGRVTFEVSTDGGVLYTPLGAGTRISGGWELTGLSLPGSGLLRARARAGEGYLDGSSSLFEAVIPFSGLPTPEIAITGNGVNIASGDSSPSSADATDFGSVLVVSGSIVRTFTISNTGTANLTLGAVTIGGPNAASFAVTAQPVSPVLPGSSTTFQVTFDPEATGLRSATVNLANNDFDENPFSFSIQGVGALSNNADLTALTISSGSLSPVFAAGTLAYGTSVGFNVPGLTVTPTKSHPNATIAVRINGGSLATVNSGSPSSTLALNTGVNTVNVVVTAQDLTTTKTYSITVTRDAAKPGDVDLVVNPNPDQSVYGMAAQLDGRILFGGDFTTISGAIRTRIARLNADGTPDGAFMPTANSSVYCFAPQVDGKILLGGAFTTINGTTRNSLARLNGDGTLDTTFNPNLNGAVRAIGILGGKTVVAGAFTTVGGVTRNRLARFNADGTLDPGLALSVDGTIRSLVALEDGTFIIGGEFITVGTTIRHRIAKFKADGSLDLNFNPDVNNIVSCVAAQADGKILIGGEITVVGTTTRNRFARVNADGSLDTSFNPNLNAFVDSISVQADGKIIIGGGFTTIGGVTRNRIARLNSDGSLDASFNPNANGSVNAIAALTDGSIVIGGGFTSVGGVTRNRLARLANDLAIQNLSVPNSSRVQWLRGGASPETQQVAFELSTDGGATYNPLGDGTRILNGWELIGLNLPASGQIRGRARIGGGQFDGSGYLLDTLASFSGLPLPEIVVTGNGANIVDGDNTPTASDHTDFLSANAVDGSVVTRTFTILNIGSANLTLGAITIGGPQAGDFAITASPASLVFPNGSTTFQVTFNPSAPGLRSATLSIANNDNDEGPFNFAIQGTGVAPEIDVTTGSATLADNGPALVLGTVIQGNFLDRDFVIGNSGTADLIGLGLTLDGANAAEFHVIANPAATVAKGASTTFTVRFTPVTEGTKIAVLHIASNDDDEPSFEINLAASALAPEIKVEQPLGAALIGGVSTIDFGGLNVGAPGTVKTFTISNEGHAPLNLATLSIDGAQAAEFTVSAPTATILNFQESATFTVTFGPAATGPRHAVLHIKSNDADESSFDVLLLGLGVSPEIAVELAGVQPIADGGTADAGLQIVGVASQPMTFVVRNLGDGPLALGSIILTGPNAHDFAIEPFLATTLDPGSFVEFTVTFTPSAPGVRQALIQIPNNDSDENPYHITLVGGGAAPKITVSDPNAIVLANGGLFDFDVADVTLGVGNAPKFFTIRNIGTAPLLLTDLTLDGINAADFIVTPLGANFFAPGESVTLAVTFAPKGAGPRNAALHLINSDADQNVFNINLTGTGVEPDIFVARSFPFTHLLDNAATIDFGPVSGGSAGFEGIKIFNNGLRDLLVTAVNVDGVNATDFVVGPPGPLTVAPGDSTSIFISFVPSQGGPRSAAIHILSNDPDESSFDFAVTGVGTDLNVPPRAPDQTFSRAPGLTLKIPIADILAACSDPDGGVLALDNIGASQNQATISRTSTHVLYVAADDLDDSFAYTVSDGQGGVATGLIKVHVEKPGGLVQSITVTGGTVMLNFSGIPAFTYDIQRATDAAGPWQIIFTQTAPSSGQFNFTDPNPPVPTAYYRLQQH